MHMNNNLPSMIVLANNFYLDETYCNDDRVPENTVTPTFKHVAKIHYEPSGR